MIWILWKRRLLLVPAKVGWVFGFCRPESFLFKCYVLGFVEAVFVFSRNVSTKSEDPTPPAFMLHRYLHTYIYTYADYSTLRCITLHYITLQHVYIIL